MGVVSVFLIAFGLSSLTAVLVFAAFVLPISGSIVGSIVPAAGMAFLPWLATTVVVYVPLSLLLARGRPHWPLSAIAAIGVPPAVIPVVLFNAEFSGHIRFPSLQHSDITAFVVFAAAGAVFLCATRVLDNGV